MMIMGIMITTGITPIKPGPLRGRDPSNYSRPLESARAALF